MLKLLIQKKLMQKKITAEDLKLEDGDYTAEVKMEGGSGKASVTSPTGFTVKDGKGDRFCRMEQSVL